MMCAYFDHNATAPLAPGVREAMEPYWTEYGNPSSRHQAGRQAREAVETARRQVADAVGAQPQEVVFTSSGTESNNLAIKGIAAMSTKNVVATSAVEHPCVLCAARALQRDCRAFSPIGVDSDGLVDMDDLTGTAAADCALVSVMLANNETGVVQDIPAVAAAAKAAGAVFHTDAAQALGKIPVDFGALGADAMTLSGHKAGGPKGIAALVVKSGVSLAPLHDGGGQEHGLRSGTENVPAIVGFGAACAGIEERLASESRAIAALRDRLEAGLSGFGAHVFGAGVDRLPNTSCFAFPGIEGESLVLMLDQSGFSLASGAACSSMKDEPSHVLLAMGNDTDLARCAVRVSLGGSNTEEEIDAFLPVVGGIAERLRSLSAVAVG